MTHHRIPVARIPLDRDELVISTDEHGQIDIRLMDGPTGGVRFPSGKGISFPRHCRVAASATTLCD